MLSPTKPINNWTNGGLERALRNRAIDLCAGMLLPDESHVTIPKRFFEEVRRRLLGRHIQINPVVRIYTTYPKYDGQHYPEYRGGKSDQYFDPNSVECDQTTAEELNALMLTLKARDEHIVRLKQELEHDTALLDDRDKTIEYLRENLHRQNTTVEQLENVIDRQGETIREYQAERHPKFVSGGTQVRYNRKPPHQVHFINDDQGRRVISVDDDKGLRDHILDGLNEED